jgi:hypothetical protein
MVIGASCRLPLFQRSGSLLLSKDERVDADHEVGNTNLRLLGTSPAVLLCFHEAQLLLFLGTESEV